jgi:preprotein translocase subunit SecG
MLYGCDQGDVSKARLMEGTTKKQESAASDQKKVKKANETLELQKMVGANQIALAKIESEKLQQLKTLELEQTKLQAQEAAKLQESKLAYEKEMQGMKLAQEKELTMLQEQRLLSSQGDQNRMYQIVIIVSALLVLLILLLWLWIHKKNKAHEAKMHEASLRHEEFMQASQQHHEKVTKMLEIVVDEKTDKNIKKELVKLLKEQGEDPVLLLEDKKS